MTCPKCNNDVLLKYCDVCDDLIELSGKMMSDDIPDPDSEALRVWHEYGRGQKELMFKDEECSTIWST